MSKLFAISRASVALYAELSLNEAKIEPNKNFNDRMYQHKKPYSILNNNINLRVSISWYLPGGTALSIDENFRSHQTKNCNSTDKMGLRRLT